MTSAEFLAFYPQFASLIPEPVLSAFTASAALRFTDFGEDAEEARRLYVAHKLTLYARTMPSSAETISGVSSFSALASAGDGARVASKKVDDVAITYASSAGSSASASGLADLAESVYGQQLLSLLRLHTYPWYIRDCP